MRGQLPTATQIKALSKPGMHRAGEGLYLQIAKGGSRSWVLRYMLNGKSRTMGLGSESLVSLAQARDEALSWRRLAKDGVDPIDERQARQRAAQEALKSIPTFMQAAAELIASKRSGWKNAKHADQWTNTLEQYAAPVFKDLPVSEIDTPHVLEVLNSIWIEKTETASRVRGRIEAVLDWARVNGYRTGENPARWRGHLDKILPARTKVQKVKHHKAMPYQDVPSFIEALSTREGLSARALEFLILTATRSGEARGAKWSEIDLNTATWTIPAERMKSGEEHRVPLSREAMEVLEPLHEHREGPYVFPSSKGRPLSDMAFKALMNRMGVNDVTAHGFRTSFRVWCAEATATPREIAEQALAHTLTNKVEAAYRRTDLFEKRRELMQRWSAFCASANGGAVVRLARSA